MAVTKPTNNNWFSNLLPAITNFGGNAMNNAGRWVNGVATLPDIINQSISNPKSIPKTLGKIATGVAEEGIKFLGGAENNPVLGVQTGKQVLNKTKNQTSHAYNNPLDFAADLGTALSLGNMGNNEPNAIQKGGKAMKNDAIKVNPESTINGAARQKAIQDAIDRVPGTSASQKYTNLSNRMTELSDQVQNRLAADPKNIPVDEIRKTLTAKVEPLYLNGTLTEPEVAREVESYLGRMYQKAVNPGGLPDVANVRGPNGGIIDTKTVQLPQTIPSSIAYKMKQLSNDASAGLFDKERLTPPQATTLALRNGMDGIITKYHPDVKALTMEQSALFDVPKTLTSAMTQDHSFKLAGDIKVPSAVMQSVKSNVGSLAEKTGALPPIGGPLLTAINNKISPTAEQNIQSKGYNNEPNQESNHNGSIPQDSNGNYTLPVQTTPSGLYMTNAEREQREQGLTPGTPQYQKIEQDYAAGQKRATTALPGGANTFMSQAKTYMDSVNTGNKAIQAMPLDFLHGFKNAKDVAAYMSKPGSPYAQQLADLRDMDVQFISAYQAIKGVSPSTDQLINPGDSTEQAKEKWQRMLEFINSSYKQYQEPYLALTAPAGVQTSQGKVAPAPFVQPSAPQNANAIMGGSPPALNFPSLDLPPIQ